MSMEQTWRWFGPQKDPISLEEIRQVGATGIVSALHHLTNGSVWPVEEIEKRQAMIEAAGLRWSVVESVPVHEDIKRASGKWREYVANYQQTLRNLGSRGVKNVCYNFMPVLDWTRTHLDWSFPDGSTGLLYDHSAFAAFELFVLKRPGAEAGYSTSEIKAAEATFQAMDTDQRHTLARTIIAGLPGSEESFTLDNFQAHLDSYKGIGDAELRHNLYQFLKAVVPVAEESGVKLCIHPDDPPRPILGLPRVVSTESDLSQLLAAADSPANGFTMCVGSYGVRGDNDLPGMIRRHGDRLHFAHLRSVARGTRHPHDFYEDDHLAGSTDMFEIVKALVEVNHRREAQEGFRIPFRPDHGHRMLDDFKRKTNPGYSLYGRMRGIAELRGLELGIERMLWPV